MSRLWFFHRIDVNVGDYLAGPYRYWDWGPHLVADICDLAAISQVSYSDSVIIGGGGLLMPWFDQFRARLLQQHPSRVVWWGVGERRLESRAEGFLTSVDSGSGITKNEFESSHLVGVRTLSSDLRFVPCASCKYVESFVAANGLKDGEGVAIFEHANVALARDLDHPRLVNRRCSPVEAISFVSQAKILVTNSYHGMYWGSLLGKQVICVPFSSAHYRYPWTLTYCHPDDLDGVIEKVGSQSGCAENENHLDIAVAANNHFRGEVMAYLQGTRR